MDELEYQLTDCQMRLEVMQDRCQRIAAENARLREELQRHKDYQELKQRWAEDSLRGSATRSTPRPPIIKSPHGEKQ